MKRRNFFAVLAALAATPFVKSDTSAKKVPPAMSFDKYIDKYTVGIDPIDGGAGEILRIYNETGILVWKKNPGGQVEWRPFKVIERHGKVRQS